MCGEKKSEKISEFEMGVEPTTFQTLVGFSNSWATKNSSDEQVIILWADITTTFSHIMSYEHTSGEVNTLWAINTQENKLWYM